MHFTVQPLPNSRFVRHFASNLRFMRLFQAALDTPLDGPFSATLSVHGLHFTVCAPSKIRHLTIFCCGSTLVCARDKPGCPTDKLGFRCVKEGENLVLSQGQTGFVSGTNRGRPKRNRTQKIMFMCHRCPTYQLHLPPKTRFGDPKNPLLGNAGKFREIQGFLLP